MYILRTPIDASVSNPSLASSQPGGFGGLLQTTTQQTGGGGTPLLYPQGSYGANQTPTSAPQTRGVLFPGITEPAAMKTVQATPFGQTQFFTTTLSATGNSRLRFIWNNEELSMEEVRAKTAKYTSLNNLA